VDKRALFDFLDTCGLGVLSTLGPGGAPQSALVGIAVTPELEIVFDTVAKSRKFANIARDPRVAFVLGWQAEVTVQSRRSGFDTATTTKARRKLLHSSFDDSAYFS
jgi:pyridoxine/pyridoxamine 5'-phosphate oxidase